MNNHKNIIFYDGECGLCHHWVKFVLPKDKSAIFSFSPLQGETIKNTLSEEEISQLPDSIVFYSEAGEVLTKTAAVVEILKKLSGFWNTLSMLVDVLPKALSDTIYDFVAGIRKTIFRTPETLCPIMSEKIRARFLD